MNSRTLCRETISFAAAFSPSVMLFSLLILWDTEILVNQKAAAFAQVLVAFRIFCKSKRK
jgi:FtsH-binding integral membrane protein